MKLAWEVGVKQQHNRELHLTVFQQVHITKLSQGVTGVK